VTVEIRYATTEGDNCNIFVVVRLISDIAAESVRIGAHACFNDSQFTLISVDTNTKDYVRLAKLCQGEYILDADDKIVFKQIILICQ